MKVSTPPKLERYETWVQYRRRRLKELLESDDVDSTREGWTNADMVWAFQEGFQKGQKTRKRRK